MADVLSQLFAFKWRDVEVPISRLRMSLAHDLVEHKYIGVNGARVEDTGVAPLRIHATMPLFDGIVPGKQEAWDPASVYGILRPLILSFSRRDTGILQTPEFGGIACKAEKLDIDWDAMKRGGCEAEASWVENLDDNVQHEIKPSPVAAMEGAARDLDGTTEDIRALVPAQPVYLESLEDLMGRVAGAFDQTTLLAGRLKAPLDRLTYRAQQIQDSAERAKSAFTWPAVMAAEQVKASANDVRRQLVEANRQIGLYLVPADTTLAGVALDVPDASITDLIRLNPQIMRDPIVHKGSVIRYFGAPLAA
jgi:hypothetical protein